MSGAIHQIMYLHTIKRVVAMLSYKYSLNDLHRLLQIEPLLQKQQLTNDMHQITCNICHGMQCYFLTTTFPLFIFTSRWLQDSRMGRLKLVIFHPRKASSGLAACFCLRSRLGSTSTYTWSNFSSPVHGMTGLSDISMC